MDSPLRKALIISYHFPPAGGVKIQRAVKLAKYLPDFGWRPMVLAPEGEARHSEDRQSLKELSGRADVYRARVLDPLRFLYRFRSRLRRQKQTTTAGNDSAGPRTFFRRLLGLLFFPDTAITWLPTAVCRGYQLCKRFDADLIFSTSPPFSAHLIAWIVSKITRRPFVIDLRDLWMGNPFVQPANRLHAFLGRRLERRVLSEAARITCATPHLAKAISERYGPEIAKKTVVITNGFDPADFVGEAAGRPVEFTVVHGGSLLLQSGRDHRSLTRGMILALERDADFAGNARLVYYGFMDSENLSSWHQLTSSSPWRDRLRYLGPVPHQQAIEIIRGASLLLFLAGRMIDWKANRITEQTETHSIAAKLFEYLPCEHPILLVAEDCPTVRLALESGLGIWCNSYDPERIADFLLESYGRFHRRNESLAPDREVIARYSRVSQAQRFASVFFAAVRPVAFSERAVTSTTDAN
jgi:hypothetical protein